MKKNFLSDELLKMTKNAGDAGELIRSIDWSKTAIGAFESWPQSLKTSLSICFGSKFPMFVWWGKELTVFYNDAYIPFLGLKHPTYFGKRAREQWSEIWEDLRPLTESVLESGQATWAESMPLYMTRKGFLEETYFTFSYSPIRDESGAVGGIINPCQETTERVLAERRLKTLRDLGAHQVKDIAQMGQLVTSVLSANSKDIPFALIYLTSPDGKTANLIDAFGIKENSHLAPKRIDLLSKNGWSFYDINQTRQPDKVNGLRSRFFEDLPSVPHDERPDSAYVLPIELPGLKASAGFLVLGISPRLTFDELYQGFFSLVCKQITNHISNVYTLDIEKKRAETLAEIDRTKTKFFSNVSHEFRTPLTLLLGPLEEIIRDPNDKLSSQKLQLIHRNALRLQKLVNSLLDFSRIEAGRMQANYKKIDIAKFTAEITNSFESAVEQAGLKLKVHCDKITKEVFVDPDLWEKIVLNLISNALKFTFEGHISIRILNNHTGVSLQVSDTGIGISDKDLSNIFERFYRVENAKSRTHEGSGIGLALVHELVKLHGGNISVQSNPGEGTTFSIHIPYGSAHLPTERVAQEKDLNPSIHSHGFIEESLHWSAKSSVDPNSTISTQKDGPIYRIVFSDDNLDMRDYIHRLLIESGKNWEVFVASNGEEALKLSKTHTPDLILTDVMMPVLDGFGLLKAIRGDETLQTTPIIFISARTGEDAKIEGIERGVDDYLIKPFSARELIARVSNQLEMSTMRKEAAQQAQANIAKSQFLANMSHEMRTPLGVMIGFAELVLNPKISENEKDDFIKTIIKNGHQLTHVISEILDLSKIESDRLEIENRMFPLVEFIEDIITPLNLRAQEKGLSLNIIYDSILPENIGSDPTRLRQILLNAIGNAIKFTDHGQIELRIKFHPDKSQLEFAVIDSGIGITAEQQKKLFKRFTQADNSMTRKYGGTGLGLVVSQKLARALGGDFVLTQSHPNQGSTFVLTISNKILSDQEYLPFDFHHKKIMDVVTKYTQKEGGKNHPLNSVKVLLVEDSSDNRILISQILKSAGASVVCASDGTEGVSAALASNCDIVLMDLQMPKKDGFEATAELRSQDFQKPIIALTAHIMKGDRERCLQSGFNDHIGKPIDRNQLITTITTWVT
ncbi:MAG: ATP-binding protein [Bdellovibrionota bacterium]